MRFFFFSHTFMIHPSQNMLSWLLVLLASASAAVASNDVIRSTDELQLSYVHRNAAPLYGSPGEMHRLELVFRNRAAARGTFKVT